MNDDIDILLTLNPHGWSTCFFVNRDDKYEIVITLTFGDPYYDLIMALKKLIKGDNEVSFIWYGEPGGDQIEIKRLANRHDIVIVNINSFSESYGEPIKEFKKQFSFDIKLKQLIIIFYHQLYKINDLMREKSYAKLRSGDFPFNDFIKFEELVKDYL